MMPRKMNTEVFLDMLPVLSQYLVRGRNLWIQSSPRDGQLRLLGRPGIFMDLEAWAVWRKQLLELLGARRTKALSFRVGYEQGRREAARHLASFGQQGRAALQAGPVYCSLRGQFAWEYKRFEYDLTAGVLRCELEIRGSAEALVHRMTGVEIKECVCWTTAGYFSGHVSGILARKVITLEQQCAGQGGSRCMFTAMFDSEWDNRADWARDAMMSTSVDGELTTLQKRLAEAEQTARRARTVLARVGRHTRPPITLESLVAESECMRQVVHRARQAAISDLPILLIGGAGSGKETLARAMHLASVRKKGPFETLDCRGAPRDSLTRQLFGWDPAHASMKGVPQEGLALQCHTGTIYLNEVSSLSPDAQHRLLRLIQYGEVLPVEGVKANPCSVRIIVGSSEDLAEKVRAGTFREELYYALSVAPIELPPLSDRGTDILRLAEVFLSEFKGRYDKPQARFSDDARRALLEYAWPGNIRQLRSAVEHAVLFGQGTELGLHDLPDEVLGVKWQRAPSELSVDVVRASLRRARGNRSRAAEMLGIGRTTLWRAMKKMGLSDYERR